MKAYKSFVRRGLATVCSTLKKKKRLNTQGRITEKVMVLVLLKSKLVCQAEDVAIAERN